MPRALCVPGTWVGNELPVEFLGWGREGEQTTSSLRHRQFPEILTTIVVKFQQRVLCADLAAPLESGEAARQFG